ncbi:MAG TPA: SAM-dependent DNA methyltransferase, partial [Streptosporangiaceae bacterium]|nr:SAM-dependent DNA methyltransferase [Streptosporangiaceae bacterium]
LIHQFDHRLACYSKRPEGSKDTELPRLDLNEKSDPARCVLPRYWVPEDEVEKRLAGRWGRCWLLGWRDICRSTDERTMISAIVPRSGVGGIHIAFPKRGVVSCLEATLNSFVLDYVARQKNSGTHLAFFIVKQLPILHPDYFSELASWDSKDTLAEWVNQRVLELSYTSYDMDALGRDLRTPDMAAR